MTRAKPVGAAGEVRQKFAFEMQMRWWASPRRSLWGGSPLPSPPLPEIPRAPWENNAPEGLLKYLSGWDVPAPALRRAQGGGRGSIPKAKDGG